MWKRALKFSRLLASNSTTFRSVHVLPACWSQSSAQLPVTAQRKSFYPNISSSQFQHAYAIIRRSNKDFLSNYISVRDIPSLLSVTEDGTKNCTSTTEKYVSLSNDEHLQNFLKLSTYHPNDYLELVENLKLKVNHFSSQDILKILQKIHTLVCSGSEITSKMFNDLITSCDGELVKKMMSLSLKESFQALDLLYALEWSSSSKLHQRILKRVASVVPTMTSKEICQYLFFCSIDRSFPTVVNQYKLEEKLSALWPEFNIDDLAVISMTYFVCEWGFKDLNLIRRLSKEIQKEAGNIQDLPLSNMLKVIRKSTVSSSFEVEEDLENMMAVLKKQIHRFNVRTSVQLMLSMTTGFNRFDPEIIEPTARKALAEKQTIRLKDIERVAFCLSVSDMKSKALESFWSDMEKELLSAARKSELKAQARSLVSTLVYFITAGHYPKTLIHLALSPKQVRMALSQGYRNTGRELMVIDSSVRIECPDYDGPMLTDDQISQFTPLCHPPLPKKTNKTFTFADRFILDLVDLTGKIFTNQDIEVEYIRPHFSTPDIVVSEKGSNGKSVICVVVPGTRSMYLRRTTASSGVLEAKKRQLRCLGLPIVEVPFHEYTEMKTWNKLVYLRKKFSLALNRKV